MSTKSIAASLKKGESYLIISPENRRYFTGFDSSDGFLFITPDASVFLTDSRYIEAAKSSVKYCDEVLLLKKASEQIPALLSGYGISKVCTESEKLTVAQLNYLKSFIKAEIDTAQADREITALRRQKSSEEKAKIIAAQRIAEKAFNHILGFIKPGVTEKDIRLELEFFMLRNGADALSFETIAISGKNTSRPHGVPTDKKVESGDFVTMDYGALKDGYHSDMTRTVAVGSVGDKQAEVYNTVLDAQLASIASMKQGTACADADKAARSIIEAAGYGGYFGHGTGHGVGIDIHEAPSVSPSSKETLRCGDVVTAEPGIYIPGEFGVRIEDMLFITEDGCENLTKCKKSLIVL
ncbi:MAG: aminopeptidase P family protein [Clostridia bacterium]|nr:aminopeptidase P family protein [Clostridia bacterium]